MSSIAEKLPEVTQLEWLEVNQFNRDITEEFLQQQHLSPHTLKQYESCLRIFFRFVMQKCGNLPLHELRPKHALQYQNFLMARGLSSNAVKIKRSAVSSLCGYLELYHNDSFPLFRNIYSKQIPNPPRSFKHEKKPLSPEEFDHLVSELEKRGEWQMVAYVQFSFDSGCRRGESVQILKSVAEHDYIKDPQTGYPKNYYMTHNVRTKGRGKIGKIRKLIYSDISMQSIKNWLKVRGDDESPFLFVTKTKAGKVNQVAPSTFNDWCSNVFSEIMGRRVHPHQLRSSRATALSNEGKNIEKIKSLLGHESSETTKIYIVNEGEDDIDDLF